jgi:hypothetical protein
MNNGTATKRKNWLGIDITETAGYKKSVYGYQWSTNRGEWMYKINKDKNIWVSG